MTQQEREERWKANDQPLGDLLLPAKKKRVREMDEGGGAKAVSWLRGGGGGGGEEEEEEETKEVERRRTRRMESKEEEERTTKKQRNESDEETIHKQTNKYTHTKEQASCPAGVSQSVIFEEEGEKEKRQ